MIPKLIHFIWVGNKEIPKESLEFIRKWKEMYWDFDVVLWNDDRIRQFDVIPDYLKNYYNDESLSHTFRSDISRYLILQKYGGLYFDVDFESLRRIPDSFFHFNFLSSFEDNKHVSGAFIASQENSDILNKIIDSITSNIDFVKSQNRYNDSNLSEIIGPIFFTKICKEYFNRDDYFFFSSLHFYPYLYNEKHRKNENFKITSPIAYAVHHWFDLHINF